MSYITTNGKYNDINHMNNVFLNEFGHTLVYVQIGNKLVKVGDYSQQSKRYCIYAWRNPFTGELYIGQTVNFVTRIRMHFSELCKHKKKNPKWVRAFMEQPNYWQVFLLGEYSSIMETNRKEEYFIDKFCTFDKFGYNQCGGGGNSASKGEKVYIPNTITISDRNDTSLEEFVALRKVALENIDIHIETKEEKLARIKLEEQKEIMERKAKFEQEEKEYFEKIQKEKEKEELKRKLELEKMRKNLEKFDKPKLFAGVVHNQQPEEVIEEYF